MSLLGEPSRKLPIDGDTITVELPPSGIAAVLVDYPANETDFSKLTD